MQNCGMQQENEVPTQNVMEMLLCFCGFTKLNALVSRIFLSLTASKITENVELTKKVTGKTSTILYRRYGNCLDAANLYLELSNQVLKLVCFKDLE